MTISHAVVSLKVVVIVREITNGVEIIVELVLIFVHDAACVGMRQLPLLVMCQAVLSLLMMGCGLEKIVFVIIVHIMVNRLCVVIVHSADKSVVMISIMMVDNVLMDRLVMIFDKNIMTKVM